MTMKVTVLASMRTIVLLALALPLVPMVRTYTKDWRSIGVTFQQANEVDSVTILFDVGLERLRHTASSLCDSIGCDEDSSVLEQAVLGLMQSRYQNYVQEAYANLTREYSLTAPSRWVQSSDEIATKRHSDSVNEIAALLDGKLYVRETCYHRHPSARQDIYGYDCTFAHYLYLHEILDSSSTNPSQIDRSLHNFGR